MWRLLLSRMRWIWASSLSTCELIVEVGYERLSIEGVAARAGVGKQTVYRRWGSKSSLVSTALLQGKLPVRSDPLPDTGDVVADLRIWVATLVAQFADPLTGSLIRAASAAAANDDETAAGLFEQISGPAREALMARLAAGVSANQVLLEADLATAGVREAPRRHPAPLPRRLGVIAAGPVGFHVDMLGGEFGGDGFLIGHEFNGDGDFFVGAGAHVDDGNFFAQHEDQWVRWGDGVDR